MPKRQNIVQLDSSKVQGEGSYVIVRRQIVEEMRTFLSSETWAELQKSLKDDATGGAVVIDIAKEASGRIIEWNWVDDNDDPLPLPKDDPEVFDRLTDQEFMFLSNALGSREAEERKN
ncbi:hypothetical protein KKH23_07470 [Patescibacteria group bacterium]|nr:hypothetical protein [Patescibacteria group bacterium]